MVGMQQVNLGLGWHTGYRKGCEEMTNDFDGVRLTTKALCQCLSA